MCGKKNLNKSDKVLNYLYIVSTSKWCTAKMCGYFNYGGLVLPNFIYVNLTMKLLILCGSSFNYNWCEITCQSKITLMLSVIQTITRT